jgi:ribosome-associated protein
LKDVRKLQKAVVSALEDIKARDILAFDVTHITAMFDRVIIASADSGRQLKALARNVQDKARDAGWRVSGIEGEDSGDWVLVDLGDIIVHLMQPAVRVHYNLEELWGQPKPRAPRKPAATEAPPPKPARAARPAKSAKSVKPTRSAATATRATRPARKKAVPGAGA